MDEEERNLQVRLAQLQTDVQIWLTMCFGAIAVFIALTLAAWQEYFTISDNEILKNSFLAVMFVSIVGMAITTGISAKQMEAKRAEMDDL